MTKVYCCNFKEQIYQWFEYRKNNWGCFSLYLIKLWLKTIGWKEQEPEIELSVKHLELSIAHNKACCNLVWHGLNRTLNISQLSRSLLWFVIKDYGRKAYLFMLEFPKSERKFSLNCLQDTKIL